MTQTEDKTKILSSSFFYNDTSHSEQGAASIVSARSVFKIQPGNYIDPKLH